MPNNVGKMTTNYSPNFDLQKRDKKNDKPHEAVGEASQLQKTGMFLDAGRVLKDAYKVTTYYGLLTTLENIYQERGHYSSHIYL